MVLDRNPKGSMQVYGIYLRPKGVPMYLLYRPKYIYQLATWKFWGMSRVEVALGTRMKGRVLDAGGRVTP